MQLGKTNHSEFIIIENIKVKPTSLTNQIINKKAQLGESVISRMASTKCKMSKTANEINRSYFLSSSSSASSFSSSSDINKQFDDNTFALVDSKQQKIKNIELAKSKKTDNTIMNSLILRRQSSIKDDSVLPIDPPRLLSVSMRKKSNHSLFRSLRFKKSNKGTKSQQFNKGKSNILISTRCRKSLDDIDIQIEEISKLEIVK